MGEPRKYYNVCDETIYIILKCFVDETYISVDDIHPCLTKESKCETRKHVVTKGYVSVVNMQVTMSKNVFWTNPRITEKGLKFLDDHSHLEYIYENFTPEP